MILAGQSYGGAISLEASDAATGGGNYRNLNRYLLEALAAQKGGRVVVLVAPDDAYRS